MNDENRVRAAAFNITSRFEGGGYHTVQAIDTGIISYGRFQFTLVSGDLERIVNAYLTQSNSATAQELRHYQSRLANRDETLRQDRQFRDLLISAAREPIMQHIQDEEVVTHYWEPLKRIALKPRNLHTPLACALLFDISMEFGLGDGFLRMAEAEYGVPPRSRVLENGLSEETLVTRVAELYKRSHDHRAVQARLPGPRVRSDFWQDLIARDDWQLQGDEQGNIYVKGQGLQIRTPQNDYTPYAELNPDRFYVTPAEDRVRIRVQPINGNPVGSTSIGDILEVLESNQDARRKIGVQDQWLYVRLPDGTEGYAAAWLFTTYQEPAVESRPLPEPITQPDHPVAATPDQPVLLITPVEDRVRVRTHPADGETVAFLSIGDVAEVLEPYERAANKVGIHGQWLAIRTEGNIEGFVAARFFNVYEAAFEAQAQTDQVLRIIPLEDRIRVRDYPINGEPIALLSLGEIVDVLEPYAQAIGKVGVENEWLNIRTAQGVEGFTAARYFGVYEEPEPPEPIPMPAPVAENQTLLITAIDDGIRVREMPVDGEPIGMVSRGEIAEVLEPVDTAIVKLGVPGEWLHIRTSDGIEGYTAAWFFVIHERELYITPIDDRIRVRAHPVNGETLGYMSLGDIIQVQEPYDEAITKIGVQDQWLRVVTPDNRAGYVAAWFFREYTGQLPGQIPIANMTGINLDLYHSLGTPHPSRLGQLGWVRFVYNVSLNPDKSTADPARFGNTDLNATYARYEPVIAQYLDSGLKIILVFNHQTFGEGAGYNWFEMDSRRWRDLSDKFAALAGRIAQQYKGRGFIYQIWNEMDAHTGAHASVPLPPKDYAYMLAQSLHAIRSADPLALVITGGHASGPASGVLYARRTLSAMPTDMQPDGIAFHPYGRGAPQSSNKYRMFGTLEDSIQAYSQVLPGKPLWITEWGVLNAPDEAPDDIAAYAREFMGHLKSYHARKIAASVWFAWAQGMDNGYGIVDANDNPREGFTSEFVNL